VSEKKKHPFQFWFSHIEDSRDGCTITGGLEAKPAPEHAVIKVKSETPAKIIHHELSANSRIHQPMARPMRAAASRA
jgi:hypothetical protein